MTRLHFQHHSDGFRQLTDTLGPITVHISSATSAPLLKEQDFSFFSQRLCSVTPLMPLRYPFMCLEKSRSCIKKLSDTIRGGGSLMPTAICCHLPSICWSDLVFGQNQTQGINGEDSLAPEDIRQVHSGRSDRDRWEQVRGFGSCRSSTQPCSVLCQMCCLVEAGYSFNCFLPSVLGRLLF